MRADRLLAEVIYLLEHGRVTARELARRFEVSRRTVLRDMEALGMAGIPVAAFEGAGGGFALEERYRLDHRAADREDVRLILTALRALSTAVQDQKQLGAIEKFQALEDAPEALKVDLSALNEDERVQQNLRVLRAAIRNGHAVRMGYVGEKLMASPLSRGSGVVSSFMKADGILTVPQGVEGYEAGEQVPVRLLSREDKLKNTLVVIGSHDPLLDELANLMHLEDGSVYMSSAHVGSMGGIMAIRRGEAHAAGCHLLDTETGEYNTAFIKKYFPKGGVKLLRCVGRQQGLMLQKGNPLGIEKFADIARPGLRFVNRQKGSGTRILTDYLCKKEGLAPETIYGYDREELTHTSVAAQLASGSADAGMGIYSAAQLYDLDFLPVCIEEYDLIIPDHAWDSPMVRQLVATLKSQAFREKILAMGGYTLDRPGEIIEIKG